MVSLVGSNRLTAVLIPGLMQRNILALPDERSSHAHPVVRGAGLAMVLTWVVMSSITLVIGTDRSGGWWGLMLLALGMALIGLWSDVSVAGPAKRLLAQVLVASVAVTLGVAIDQISLNRAASFHLGFWSWPLSVLTIVVVVNFFNFMDGVDGIAAGQTLLSSFVVMVAALIGHVPAIAFIAASLAGAAGGFLPFNWSPARCFMGDVGSYFCGAAYIGVLFVGNAHGLPILLVGLSSAIFLLDAGVTLVRRLFIGERLWLPHRRHVYQRLVQRGWSHARVAAIYMAAALVLGTGSLICLAWVGKG